MCVGRRGGGGGGGGGVASDLRTASDDPSLVVLFVSCALGDLLGGSQGGHDFPPGYMEHSATGKCPNFVF
jgi:hypothetical protein